MPKLSHKKHQKCEDAVTGGEVKETVNTMENNKSPGNDEFVKNILLSFIV